MSRSLMARGVVVSVGNLKLQVYGDCARAPGADRDPSRQNSAAVIDAMPVLLRVNGWQRSRQVIVER